MDATFTGPLSEIPPFRYSLIMADPPWSFKNYSSKGEGKGAKAQYDCLTLADIQALPVGSMAGPDCMLWLWATNPMLPQAIATMTAWGFTFKTAGHWVKRQGSGKLAFGTGYILRAAGEPFLIGTIGKPKTTRATRSVIEAPRREHSRKPDEAFAAAEALIPGAQRIELFSRERRAGWDTWGDQTERFKQCA